MGYVAILFAIGSTMLCNCFFLTSSFVVKNYGVAPGQVTVFSALLRTLIFGPWAIAVKCRGTRRDYKDPSQDVAYGISAWFSLVTSNLAIAVSILLSYVAVSLIPICDFTVFRFTSPIFTLLFEIFRDRSKASLINTIMCILIVVGTGLVSHSKGASESSELQPHLTHHNSYYIGATFAMVASFLTGVGTVLQAKCKDIPMAYFMALSGLAMGLIGLLCPFVGLPNHLLDQDQLRKDLPISAVVALSSMLGLSLYQLAVAVSNAPLIVSATRSVEIVMALIIDLIQMPTSTIDYGQAVIWYKIVGAIIVLTCVIGISLSDILEEKIHVVCNIGSNGITAG